MHYILTPERARQGIPPGGQDQHVVHVSPAGAEGLAQFREPVFGRIGSRPFTLEEMRQLFLKPDGTPWYVSNRIDDHSTAAAKDDTRPAPPRVAAPAPLP